jgi:hypothetical protein
MCTICINIKNFWIWSKEYTYEYVQLLSFVLNNQPHDG